jgi:DNA-binding CsgD family transcriptional regulator/tetratricopeptide (TPR) repeat protein
VLRGRSGEQESDLPLAVVRELFEAAVLRADDDERVRLLTGAAGFAGRLVGANAPIATDTDSAFAMVHGLYWLTANFAEASPLVLAIDDAHWADEATQRWLAYLIPRVHELPVLLALTVRPRELAPESRLAAALATDQVMLIKPSPLTGDGTRGMLEDLLVNADAAFSGAIHRATGGNPLLVRILATALIEAAVEPTTRNVERIEALGATRVGRVVLPRLHRLGPQPLALARAAAVLGDKASLSAARALAGLDYGADEAALDALVAIELMAPDRSLQFSHPLFRAVVADELAPGESSDLHRRAARILHATGDRPEAIARHLLATEPVGEPWAVESLRAAARVATGNGAPLTAVTFLERALREQPEGPLEAEVLLELGQAAFRARNPHALEWLADAMRAAQEPNVWVSAMLALSVAAGLAGEPPPDALATVVPPALDADLSLAMEALLMVDFYSGLPRIPVTIDTENIPLGKTHFERMWLAAAAKVTVMGCTSADFVTELADRALANDSLLMEAPDSWPVSWAGWSLMAAGHLERARDEAGKHIDVARRNGALTTLEFASSSRAVANLRLGDVAEAEADMSVAIDAEGHMGWAVGLPVKRALLLDVCVERGELSRADTIVADAGPFSEGPALNLFELMLLESRGRFHLARGRITEALDDFESCGRRLHEWDAGGSVWFTWRGNAARCLFALGDGAAAQLLAGEQVEDARRFGAAPWLGNSLRSLGVVTGGDEGIDLLNEAVAVLIASQARLEHAHASYELGVLLRRNRHPRDARGPLHLALDLAVACGAVALADRAEAELRAAGAKPRRRAFTGVDALTPAERRVARLAADGGSNPEIAQSLFVTRKTVEKHLSNVFLKLAISSRAELTALLGSSPQVGEE